jgi:hypothetical protein
LPANVVIPCLWPTSNLACLAFARGVSDVEMNSQFHPWSVSNNAAVVFRSFHFLLFYFFFPPYHFDPPIHKLIFWIRPPQWTSTRDVFFLSLKKRFTDTYLRFYFLFTSSCCWPPYYRIRSV